MSEIMKDAVGNVVPKEQIIKSWEEAKKSGNILYNPKEVINSLQLFGVNVPDDEIIDVCKNSLTRINEANERQRNGEYHNWSEEEQKSIYDMVVFLNSIKSQYIELITQASIRKSQKYISKDI